MRRTFPILSITLVLLLAAWFHPRGAQATLGERADSVARDRRALAATHRATVSHANYTVQEEASGSSTIREYVNSSGIVFAVAWEGRMHPDLPTLLGSYATEYRDAARRNRTPGHGPARVSTDRVVVETWGQMRSLHGRAYLPGLMPTGVNADEIE